MSTPRIPPPAKLLVSLLFRPDEEAATAPPWLVQARERLEQLHGPVDFVGEPRTFTESSYYADELGPAPRRIFLAFARPVARERLAEIKCATNAIEDALRDAAGRRRINLDPGLLSQENLVLATGKNRGHRVYLGRGIFAEVTLIYRRGTYQPLPWTYPDYAAPWCGAMLAALRPALL